MYEQHQLQIQQNQQTQNMELSQQQQQQQQESHYRKKTQQQQIEPKNQNRSYTQEISILVSLKMFYMIFSDYGQQSIFKKHSKLIFLYAKEQANLKDTHF